MPRTRILVASLLMSLALVACTGGDQKPELLLASARDYLANNDPKAAAIQVKNALQQDTRLPEGRYLLGLALLRTGDASGAEAELRKALDLKYPEGQVAPPLAQAMLVLRQYKKLIDEFAETELRDAPALASLKTTLAVAYFATGKAEPAQAALKAALAADPDHAPALLAQVRSQAGQGDLAGALAGVESMLARHPANQDAWKLKGDLIWDTRQDAGAALAAYRKAIEIRPDFADARAEALAMLMRQGKTDEAVAELSQLKGVAPNAVQTIYYETLLAFEKKDFKNGMELAQQLVRIAPDNVRGLQLAGDMALQSDALTQAESHLAKAVQMAPQAVLARQLLVMTYLRLGQLDKARSTLEPLLAAADPDVQTLALAGDVYRKSGDVAKAQGYFTRMTKLDPSNARARTALALTHMRGADAAAAIGELRSVAASDAAATADLSLIAALMVRGEFDQALKAIDALEKKQPDKPQAHDMRGRVLLATKDVAGARKSFERAVALDPLFFPAVDRLAALDLADKNPDQARKRFEAMLAKDPRSTQAMMAQAQLTAMTGGTAAQVAEQITRATLADPTQPAPWLALVKLHMQSKDFKQAVSVAQKATLVVPGSAELVDALGSAQLAAGEASQAVLTYNKLLVLQPRSAYAYLRLADAHMKTKNTSGAAASLRRALEIDDKLLPAQRGLILLALGGNDVPAARAIARTVQKQRPGEAIGFSLEGEIAAAQKDWDTAALAYRQALKAAPSSEVARRLHAALGAARKGAEMDRFSGTWLKDHPSDAAFRLYLGDAAAARRDFAGAETLYAEVTRLQPTNAVAFNNLAWVSGRLKRDDAITYAEKAVALAPNQAGNMDTLAMLLSEKNNYAKALEWQNKAVALQPQVALFRLNLAKIHLKGGNKDLARTELDALAKLGDKFQGQAEVASLLKGL